MVSVGFQGNVRFFPKLVEVDSWDPCNFAISSNPIRQMWLRSDDLHNKHTGVHQMSRQRACKQRHARLLYCVCAMQLVLMHNHGGDDVFPSVGYDPCVLYQALQKIQEARMPPRMERWQEEETMRPKVRLLP